MEHWVFEPELLKEYAKHYETNEVIPAELIEKLDKSGKYGQGFATTEYLAASLLDMDFHVLKEVHEGADVMKFEETVLGERGLLKQIPSRYRTTYFNHTMGGGYTAGYYSYIWAEVLDADAYQAYKETGDIYLVADVLGHKDVNTTRKHYAAIEEERRKMAKDKVIFAKRKRII